MIDIIGLIECGLYFREKRMAKKYYDKLFKEYCITDLSRYKENKVDKPMWIILVDWKENQTLLLKSHGHVHVWGTLILCDNFPHQIALRWRIEKEVVIGKGMYVV